MTEALHPSHPAPTQAMPGLRLRLSPAPQPLLWRADGRVQPLPATVAGAIGATPDATDWPAWCAAHPGARCTLHLPSTLLHELLVPAEHAGSDAEALAWASAQWLHFHGEDAAPWPLAVWQLGARRGVSALHGLGPAWGALCQAAQAHGVRLQAVSPHWLHRAQQALRTEPALRQGPARLLLADGPLLGVLDFHDGTLHALQWRRVQAPSPTATLPSNAQADAPPEAPWPPPSWALWQADTGPTFCSHTHADGALRPLDRGNQGWASVAAPSVAAKAQQAAHPQRQRWAWATPAGPRLHTANFLQPTRGVHRLAWWMAGAALLALGTAALDAALAWQALQSAQAKASPVATQAQAGQPAPRPVARPTAVAPAGPAERPQAPLQRPWGAAFAALDAVALPGVQWQSLQTTDQGQWRLQGLAPDTATALAAAQALRQQPVWAQVQPGRIERQADAGVQFELSLQWRGAW
ncbi:MAG: hypothetical protein ACK5QH_12560 [Rubrivivax sp.]